MTGLIIAVFAVVVLAGTVVKVRRSSGGMAADPQLRGFGVVIDGTQVRQHGRDVGPVAGARAQVTGVSRHAPSWNRIGTLIITFPDGHVHTCKLGSSAEVRRGQVWAVKFNALAAAA